MVAANLRFKSVRGDSVRTRHNPRVVHDRIETIVLGHKCIALGTSGNTKLIAFLDVLITNLDAPSNVYRKPEAVLLSHQREKK